MRTLRDRLQVGSDDPLHLLKGRVHEVEGQGRNVFALFQAARLAGPVFWIVLAHDRDRPMPGSLPDGIAEHLYFIEARGETAPAGSRGRGNHRPDADPGGQGKQCRRDSVEM